MYRQLSISHCYPSHIRLVVILLYKVRRVLGPELQCRVYVDLSAVHSSLPDITLADTINYVRIISESYSLIPAGDTCIRSRSLIDRLFAPCIIEESRI